MKMIFTVMILLIVCLMVSCNKDNPVDKDSPAGTDQEPLPIVKILSPTNDTTLYATSDSIFINIGVTSESSITKVQLMIDSSVIHEFLAEPFSYTWEITSINGSGKHIIYATAQNLKGAVGVSPSITMNIDDPNPTSNVRFATPVIDNINATDSIYLEVCGSENYYNSLIKKIQIFVDDELLHEYNTPPMGFWWKFTGLHDNSVHSFYAKAYDWRNRSGQSLPKTITVHFTPQVVYTPYLSIGNKWYYSYHATDRNAGWDSTGQWVITTTTQSGFIIRQVTDTSSDSWHTISITSVINGSTSKKLEYWKNLGGSIYISNQPVQSLKGWPPNFITSLSQDSSSGDFAWKNRLSNFLGVTRPIQYRYYHLNLHNGAREDIIGISDGVGLVFSSKYSALGSTGHSDTTSIRGAQLGGVIYGDTTTTR